MPSSSTLCSAACLLGSTRRFQRSDLLVERGDRVFGARQRRFLCRESAGERGAAFDEGRAGLVDLLELGFALDALGLEVGHACLQGIAFKRKFAGTTIIGSDLVCSRQQVLARLAEQFFTRGGACLQSVETHALGRDFVLVALVRFIERSRKPRPFGIKFGDSAFHMAQTPLRRCQTGLGLDEFAGDAGDFGAHFVERNLLRPLFVFEHQQPLARSIELGFERHHALIRCRKPLIKPAVFFAQRLAFAGLLGKPRFEIDDLRAPCGDIDGDLCFRSLERTKQVLRGRSS